MKALQVINLRLEAQEYHFEVEQETLECVACHSMREARQLLKICGGMQEPQQGRVIVFNRELYRMEQEERVLFRRRNIGLAGISHNLLAGLNLFENLSLSLQLDGRQADLAMAERLAGMADLKADWGAHPDALSAADQQKTAVIRAVLSGASMILVCLDHTMEPWSIKEVMRFLKYVQEEYNLTVVVFGKPQEAQLM